MRWAAAAAALWCAASLRAATLDEEITDLIETAPAARSAFWGIDIVDLTTGQTLYTRDADKLFVPASNAKLFTMALALSRLGADYRFETRVLAAGPGADGVVRGGLRLIGGGDPNLSGRVIPYRADAPVGNPLAAIEDLADQIVKRGVKRVEGGIAGDDTWYMWEPYPGGWAIDDAQYDYGAPVSALTLNDNTFTMTIRPGGRVGDPAELTLNPSLEYYEIDNRVRTVAERGERKIQSEREPGSRQLRVWGTIPRRGAAEILSLAIDDPAEYAASALRQALEDRGVTVEGAVSARHRPPGQAWTAPNGVELAWHGSEPLVEDLRVTAKVSQNLHAELALRAVARNRQGEGSRQAGVEEMKAFLTENGIDPDSYQFHDGSGLARLDLVTPAAILQLLGAMYASPLREEWIGLLPIGGEDGTLNTRFADPPTLGRIHAKTGTLTHVSALSGYAQRPDGDWVAFAILVNNHGARAADVRGVIDRIGNAIIGN